MSVFMTLQDAASATLLSETKHQTTEVRAELGKLSGKVDELHSKVHTRRVDHVTVM